MQVSLFRALKSINIDDEIAAKAVEVVEEHIEMSVARAVKPLEDKIDLLIGQIGNQSAAFNGRFDTQNAKIDALATKLDSVNLGMHTAVSSMRGDINTLRWLIAATATVIATAGAAVGVVAKLPL
ncbi:hypothetical protein [Sphingomonas xinjiangensis]|uniref:SMC interacting uncharacterized protein involved in chromosome segregation n=1 Tax=Sphingomonas xinjiangensis TaxID=643568 RepID=A0A840YRV6_9SPHN|nr:hypothetical protein [Sphingomonas xinjiangensis]MBB5712401.1 SMC interacting uncharacterized protein involved in chromosome segregation [Sphingomonas xinjiangensis]